MDCPCGKVRKFDKTFVSRVSRDGSARARAGAVPGKAAPDAGQRKRHPKLLAARRCRLVVLALEVGGRFGAELADFLRRMAASKARAAPPRLRAAARQATSHRWRACWWPWHGLSRNCHLIWRTSAVARNRHWQTCWRTRATLSTCRPAASPPIHEKLRKKPKQLKTFPARQISRQRRRL